MSNEVALAPPPDWLLTRINAPANHPSVPVGGDVPAVIPEGQRNNTLMSLAGSMRRPGFGACTGRLRRSRHSSH